MRPSSAAAGAYFWRTSGPQDFALTVAGATYTMRRQLTQYPVTTMAVTEDNLHGVLYRPTLPGRHPAVVVIGGSDGGQPGRLYPTVLASRGFPVLALAYFKTPGLPQALSKVPLEYFRTAFQWLGQQPGVDPSRMVIDGVSRGGEAALLIGATFPELVHGVIAEVPSSVALCGYPDCQAGSAWTFHAQPVQFSRHMNEIPPQDNPAAVIRVENINGPVLMNCGGMDRVWDSCDYGRAAMHRLAQSHHGHQLQVCDSCDHYIGHLVPDEPLNPAVAGPNHAADAEAQPKFFRSLLALLASV
jgi:dienelactone hydrolase